MISMTHPFRAMALGVCLLAASAVGANAQANRPAQGGTPPAAAAAPAFAPSHMAAAVEAVAATRTSRGVEDVLPMMAQRIQSQFIRVRPDLSRQITDVVDEVALKLAARRADIDLEIARVWAKSFTEAELKAITAFYKSPAGVKIAEMGPQVNAEVMQAVRGWSDRLNQELAEASRNELKKRGIDF